jgi:transcriptional regulator with XRE-family HTH domain
MEDRSCFFILTLCPDIMSMISLQQKEAVLMQKFGEKVKKLREENGMTQQTMADRLYVTRQAVSRWECGARYPDLQTAKKIAQILGVSLDELLSGEELKENIEKEALLVRPVENIIQTILYTIAALSYIQISIFYIYYIYSMVILHPSLADTPAGKIGTISIVNSAGIFVCMAAYIIGLVLSLRSRLTAKLTGYIMCVPFVWNAVNALAAYIDMKIKNNGNMTIVSFAVTLAVPMIFAVCILLYFSVDGNRIPCLAIWAICIFCALYQLSVIKHYMYYITELGFVVSIVRNCGVAGMILLLAYQAYIWNRKKRAGIKADK